MAVSPHPLFQNFDADLCGIVPAMVWESQEKQILVLAIIEHLYQQGMLGVAEELCQVLALKGSASEQYAELMISSVFFSVLLIIAWY